MQRIVLYIYYSIATENNTFYNYYISMKIIYVGRLDKEKWIETLIWYINYLIQQNRTDIKFYIFWWGKYNQQIQYLHENNGDIVQYYGWKNKKEIVWLWSTMDFFFMPSTFLETFWLTACESLLLWVPVIWHKKWWLEAFITDELNIDNYKGGNDVEKTINIIDHIIQNPIDTIKLQKHILYVKNTYTISNRTNNIQNILPKHVKNILLSSDFINYNGWWIETHIHDSKDILKKLYHISLYGQVAPSWRRASMRKLILMIQSSCNIKDSYYINNMIKEQHIDTIWRHSISRVLGWLPLWVNSNKQLQQIITHHELWIFHPFPSKVKEYNQIPKPRSLVSFIKAGQTNNIFIIIGIIGKFFLIRLIHKQLQKNVDIHIVPSSWMVKIVKERHPNKQVIVIPHFVTLQ